ncbi:hypothetical protein CTI12_AA135330 [Artemisia annua]|uniref:Uncharacterized protein n=1 Tax=Artemisia annua TaxID=35608 RepID=A0A2U1PMH9_ARTAN|nr:hypothetical protein CTI12_AA135330 [Artemisia annua]
MGNCCGGSLSEYDDNASGNVPTIELDNNALELELDNNGSSSSGVPSINVVERRGKVWKCYECPSERTFYAYKTSQEHNKDFHPKYLKFCHNCNTPFKKPKARETHERTCEV